MRKFGYLLSGLMVAGFLAIGSQASANTIQYQFTIDHCTGTCGTGPFGTLTLDDQNTTGDVIVSVVLQGTDKFVNTGLGASLAFNLNGSPTVNITNLTSGFEIVNATNSNPVSAGTLGMDGFGNFQYGVGVIASGGGNGIGPNLSFHVVATGLTLASFAKLSTIPPGNDQVYFAADILGSNGNTGAVGAVAPCTTNCLPLPKVPEPTSLVLLGTGLLAATRGLRRRMTR